jgi:hypothetical protein
MNIIYWVEAALDFFFQSRRGAAIRRLDPPATGWIVYRTRGYIVPATCHRYMAGSLNPAGTSLYVNVPGKHKALPVMDLK